MIGSWMGKDIQNNIYELKSMVIKDYEASKWHLEWAECVLKLPWYKRIGETKKYEYQREYFAGRIHIWEIVARILGMEIK